MNFEDKMKEILTGSGMLDSQAESVISMAKSDGGLESMKGRWGDDISEYNPVVVTACQLHVKAVGLEWIEKNAPLAWFKPMFEHSE